MASHPSIRVLTSPCMLIYMGMIQGALGIWIYIYQQYKSSFLYEGSSLWNKLPLWVKESTSLNDLKYNFRPLNGWIHPEFTVLFYAIIVSILFTASPIYLYPELISILSWYSCFYVWIVIMICIYVFLISIYLCILLCNRAPRKYNLTEWFSMYKMNIFKRYIYIYIKNNIPPPPPPPFSNFPIDLRHP